MGENDKSLFDKAKDALGIGDESRDEREAETDRAGHAEGSAQTGMDRQPTEAGTVGGAQAGTESRTGAGTAAERDREPGAGDSPFADDDTETERRETGI